MLKFTNAAGQYAGNPLYINKDWIISVFEHPRDGGSLLTIIYGGPTGTTWEVEESLSQVINAIKGAL